MGCFIDCPLCPRAVHASSPHTHTMRPQVPEELQVVKVQLTKKYGKDFATKALNNDDSCINRLVAEKLLFQADPAPKLVEVRERARDGG